MSQRSTHLPDPDHSPMGVAGRGRGFAPAGRGRGIAKWSSQAENGYGNNDETIAQVGRRGNDRYHDDGKRSGGVAKNKKFSAEGHRNGSYYEDADIETNRRPIGSDRGPASREAPRHGHADRSARYYDDDKRPAPPARNKKMTVECYTCEEVGHMSYECPSKKTDKSYQRNGSSSEMETSRRSSDSDRVTSSRHNHASDASRNNHSSNRGSKYQTDRPHRDNYNNHSNDHYSSRDRSDRCYTCGAQGHFAKHCQRENRRPANSNSRYNNGHSMENREIRNEGKYWRENEPIRDKKRPSAASKGSTPGEMNGDVTRDEGLMDNYVSTGINFDKYEGIEVKVTGDNPINKIESFYEDATINVDIQKNLERLGYSKPTPVQKHAIPHILGGRDLMACAQTGSGKTAAFMIPVIHNLLDKGVFPSKQSSKDPVNPEVIAVAPTRELAMQIRDEAQRYSAGTLLKCASAYGGVSSSEQISQIRRGCNILTATPGRLLDFIEQRIIGLSNVNILILDEADRMLNLGFKENIKDLVRNPEMPGNRDRQTLMFSATFPVEIQRLAADFLADYIFVSVGILGAANSDVDQKIIQVSQFEKREKLLEILSYRYMRSDESLNSKILVFVEQKKTADFLASYLCQSDLPTTSIHGDRQQEEREEALGDFKDGRKPILVATDVAARGIDIKNVELVVNYDLPKDIDQYVHRIGRTGRLGNSGESISFYDDKTNGGISVDLVKALIDAEQTVPDWLMEESRRHPAGMNANAVGRQTYRDDYRVKDHTTRDTHWW